MDLAAPPPRFLIIREGPIDVKAESQLFMQAIQPLVGLQDLSTPTQVVTLHQQDEGDTPCFLGPGLHTPSQAVMHDIHLVSLGHIGAA